MLPDFVLPASPLDARPLRDIGYLLHGTLRQQAAYRVLNSLRFFERFAAYAPALAGTIPLGLDLPDSDLDLLCEVYDSAEFIQGLEAEYGNQPGFYWVEKRLDHFPVTLARFTAGGFPIEIFGQPRPVIEQRAYRHMLIEARLLRLAGEPAYRAIGELRAQGVKTEAAFARYFGLPGDPYQRLLELERMDDAELLAFLQPTNGQ